MITTIIIYLLRRIRNLTQITWCKCRAYVIVCKSPVAWDCFSRDFGFKLKLQIIILLSLLLYYYHYDRGIMYYCTVSRVVCNAILLCFDIYYGLIRFWRRTTQQQHNVNIISTERQIWRRNCVSAADRLYC